MKGWVFYNKSLVQGKDQLLSLDDRGFLYGDGVFETLRAYDCKVFRLEKHLQRLMKSLRAIRLSLPYQLKELEDAIYKTLAANHLQDAYLRLTVTRGVGGIGVDLPETSTPTLLIVAKEFVPYPEYLYQEGMKTIISKIRQNLSSPLSEIKSLNFLNNILARAEAREMGYDDALLLNSEGYLCEGSVSNLFLVREEKLITPDKTCGILLGITREAIIELALKSGIKVEERKISPSELMEADECFLTNTLMEVMPVTEVNGKKIGKGLPGSLTLHLQELYKGLVRKELGI